jgi:hypothetical protein
MCRTSKIIGIAILALTAACSFKAVALQIISYAEHGVGFWYAGSEFNGDPTLPLGVQRSVDVWNGYVSPGLWSSGKETATFLKGSGSLLPDVLPDVTYYGGRHGAAQVDNTSGEFSYLTAKYGNQQVVFYVGGINEVLVVPSILPILAAEKNRGAPGLSHVTWLGAEKHSTPLAEGGLTATMLGLGLSCLAWVRCKLN